MTGTLTLALALRQLQAQGLNRLESQMLTLHALGRDPGDRAWLLSHDDHPLDADAQQQLRAWAQRRLGGEPMAYIVGHKDFHAKSFGTMRQSFGNVAKANQAHCLRAEFSSQGTWPACKITPLALTQCLICCNERNVPGKKCGHHIF